MNMKGMKATKLIPITALLVAVGLTPGLSAQKKYEEEKVKDGILIGVLDPDAIPAINEPVFVSAKEADKFMADDEPILGLFDGKVAKAYSIWHLDRHEIVNDSLPGIGPVAVTW